MALNARQRSIYQHRIDIWTTSRTVGAVTAGKPSGELCALTTTNLPAIYKFNPNIDSETAAGRFKEFTMLVLDMIYMEANSNVHDMDFIVNVTILADGSRSNAWGEVHRVEGAPTIADTLGRRHCNNLYVEAQSIEHPPEVIRAHYGLA